MEVYNANYWESYDNYMTKKKASAPKESTKKRRGKISEQKRIQKHNTEINLRAKFYADEMKISPSELEIKMQKFLDACNVKYEFQKIFRIKNKKKYINRFYIADFYIPSKNLIIETDGAFHDQQVEKDNLRTRIIQRHYPNVKVVRWRWGDFYSFAKVKELSTLLH